MKKLFCLVLCLLLLLSGCTGPGVNGDDSSGGTMDYCFMSGEGLLSPSNGDYFSKWGDSCLIVFPNGQTMLIDTAVKGYYVVLKQRLQDLGVTKLDYVVITHPHSDHMGGAEAGLFKDFKIGQVYHNGLNSTVENLSSINGIPCNVLEMGDSFEIGQGNTRVTVKVLWPGDDIKQAMKGKNSSAAVNNQSIVMRFDYGEHSSLFTGDIYKTYSHKGEMHVSGETGAEDAIVAYYTNGELDVDLLKLPHHGDASSSNSYGFFSATTPELAVATGFIPIETHWKLYQYADGKPFNSGNAYNNKVLFDRYNGYIHITAHSDGMMTYDTSRNGYLADFGATWNPVLDRKQ